MGSKMEVKQMDKRMDIYHGSEKIIETPAFGAGRKNNDFGPGFYCTESEALAKERAASSLRNVFQSDGEYMLKQLSKGIGVSVRTEK